MTIPKIKLGMAGGGFMGKAHTNAFATIPYIFYPREYELELVAIATSSMETARLAADRFGFAEAFGSWDEMLGNSEFDAFDNGGPDPMHHPSVMKAIALGRHIYCEKPLAETADEAREMYEAAEKAKIVHMAGFNYRFFPANVLAHKLIRDGAIGRITHARFIYDQSWGASDSLMAEDIWYNNVGKAGGTGQAIGCHAIDLARFLVGEIISLSGKTKIYRKTRPSRNGGEVEMTGDDAVFALVDFADGATGTIESSGISSGKKNDLHWEIFGTRGSLAFSLEHPSYLKVFLEDSILKEVSGYTDVSVTQSSLGHPYMDVWWPSGHNTGWEHGHINALHHFFRCVTGLANVAPMGATLFDGYAAERILETIHDSSREGRRLDVKL